MKVKEPKLILLSGTLPKYKIKATFRICPLVHKRILGDVIIPEPVHVLLDPLQRQLCLEKEVKSLVGEVLPLPQNRGEELGKYF